MNKIKMLKKMHKNVQDAFDIYEEKHFYAEHGTKQRAYYKGKMNAFQDVVGLIDVFMEEYYNETKKND